MALNRLGVECFDGTRPPAPVTLPALKLDNIDIEAVERAATAAKFLEARTIRTGVECWQAIGRAESFEAWVKIGKALQIGRDYSLKATGANRPMGQIYCKAFSAWLAKHGFSGIEKSVRSAALDLVEHLAEDRSMAGNAQREAATAVEASVVERCRVAESNSAQAESTDLHKAAVLAWASLLRLH